MPKPITRTRASSIARLDPAIKVAVDTLIREGRVTQADIVDAIRALGGDASKSAVGRYVKNAREQMEGFRQAQEMAKVWAGKLAEDPESDLGRLLSRMLQTVAFQHLGSIDDGSKAGAGDLLSLARMIKDIASADKTRVELSDRIRRQTVAAAAEAVEKSPAAAGLSRDVIDAIKAQILGIAE